jgi:uncharacterized protein (TIGR02271 family)
MFASRAEAGRAVEQLASDLGVERSMVRNGPETGASDAGYNATQPYQETGFLASLRELSLPEEDRFAYAEGMRRGNVLVSAKVDEAHVERAADILEHAGAVDLDQLETEWRQSGWTGYDASAAARPSTVGSTTTAAAAGASATGTSARAGQEEVIPIVEESLVVGKREVERGRTRIRSYVVERPVQEQVRLREERVNIERHAVDRPLAEGDRPVFQERVLEVNTTGEEAVVSKQAHVVEEVVVQKSAVDRTETVHDTVRRTEVEIGKEQAGVSGAAASGPGVATTSNDSLGSKAGRAVDNTLGTNISGTNPGKAS